MSRRADRPTGFTLIETLVALTVLAIALSAVLPAVRAVIAGQGRLEDRSFAQWVAMNALAELQTAPDPPTAGERTGTEQMAGRTWAWHARVTARAEVPLLMVEVSVRHPGDGAPIARVRGYLGGP